MEVYFKNLTPENAVAGELLRDLSALGDKSEEFFRASEGKLTEKTKQNFLDGLKRVKASCRDLQKQSAWINKPNGRFPYGTMGIMFGLGVLTAAVLLRKPRE